MQGFSSPFGGGDASFDDAGTFVPEHLPEPGPFLTDHDVLTGNEHCAVHGTAATLFEERGVYDATFGYNLARLNRDQRHPDAGFRYAVDSEDGRRVLRAEFTPTTPFCPQSNSLVVGSFRAWNGLADQHAFDLVRVRVATMHNESGVINDAVVELEATFEETGSVPEPSAVGGSSSPGGDAGGSSLGGQAGGSSDAPF
ncbi:hypothetical protein [Haloarchaeobius iranensis]|uniref:DUF7998 domain-containing protein n=1 Tax=Haloarchaeobius iranensis TaxID=996166 RepID=A0A1G9TMK6_9EURY|nr:hypothetical protein [Haloarchaeobius iranensis]SDM48654.1 hypothetical protein SAMN05192554_10310 [Haloarchaeobius iranensis]